MSKSATCELAYIIVKKSRALHQHGRVVRELRLVDIGTVGQVSTIVNIPVRIDIAQLLHEVKGSSRQLHIRIIIRVPSQAGSDIEITSIGNGCTKSQS